MGHMVQEYHFSIRGTRFLDHEGRAVRPLPDWAEPPGKLVEFYKMMALTRTLLGVCLVPVVGKHNRPGQ